MATADAGGDIYRGARAKYRAYAEEFKNRKIVADLITTKRGTDERRVALEDVHKRTIKDGSVDEITKLRDTLRGAGLDGQQAWRELQGQTIAEIRDAALKNTARNERGAKVVSHAGMNRVVQTLDKDGKLDLVFGKKGAELLRDLNDLAADVYTAPPGSVNFSNTASALRNLFDNLVTYGVSGLPVPAREVMGQIGRMLRSRGLRKRVDEAVPASQPARGGDIKPGVFEPPATPPAAPPAPRGGGPSGPSAPPGQGNLFPPTTGAAAPAQRKQLLGRAPEIKKLPVPEVIEDSAPRIPVPEVIEGAAPVPAGAARELTGAELDAPELADWLKAHRFGNEAGADALRVDKALQIDPEAVQRAATQHARQPGSFIRAVDGIIEKGQKDATDTGSAARGGEGLPREGGSEAGNRQGEGAAPGAQDGAGSAQADGAAQVAPDASAAETARMNREAVETHVAAAMREFEKATAPSGNPITDRLADKLRSDYSRAVEEYDRLPDTTGGRILNTDIARELSADYLQNRTRAADVHEPASAFIKRRYAEKLAGPTPEGLDRRVLFTAGGAGAGKSSVVRELLTDEAGQSEITYDTNMDGLGSSILKIEQALNAGREVSIAYVYAKPEDAFQQAMKRTMNQKKEHGTGRTVPIQVFIDTHIGVSKTIRNLADRYRHDLRVEFSFLDNSRGYKNAAAVPWRDLPVVADNGLREKLEAAAQEAFREGRIDADTLAGFLAAHQHAPRAPRVGAADGGRSEPGGGEGSPDALTRRPALAGPSGSQTSVVTERGMRVPVRYRLVELDDLITSHTNDLTVNPAFPAELQPRDRTRASSQAQIARIANDIQPDLMAESPKASDGAPIIGPDGLVESGNARTIALRRAYGMGKADHYKAYLAENADRFGLTPEQVAGFKQP
ncbi:MAG: zeta toxin family protein, partial [Burkholderiaceae bacterium]|nr:zeta toxin family protein [Burkholderiaceae bacterium]